MTVEQKYQERYKAGRTPWDIGKPDFNLVELATRRPIAACKALDVGCGTGDNTIWLAQQGFDATGSDASSEALAKAREKAAREGADCRFLHLDFMREALDDSFAFIFDRGCFHSFAAAEDRARFAQNVAAHLTDKGLWLSILGNADEKRDHPGPPQRTALDIVTAVERHFEILILAATQFGSLSPTPPRAWRCLMQKR